MRVFHPPLLTTITSKKRRKVCSYVLWIDSTHCGSCFGYEARRRQTLTERPEYFAKRTSGRGPKEMLANVVDNPTFTKRIITGNKTWVYEYDVEIAQQSSE